MDSLPYCSSRFSTVRRSTRAVKVGALTIGGDAPLVVQSMTTTPTLDTAATLAQCIALAEAGCDVVRITAQNVKAAEALGPIRKAFSAAGFAGVPLVADIHFLPQAAMEAALHVEKVRINPGNYADKKRFQQKEYSDADYAEELERLHEAFSPIVQRCKEYGRAMRIGTNHGSLSDRILNRYGDTPLGMCESAMEFLRIAEHHGFHDIILSMKASNPKVMIQAYRLIVAMMAQENMHYPLHLGVTEAGDGDDARIKSAIGIGGLLLDGLGDTLRVSLTEDPVAEVPVARALADMAMAAWQTRAVRTAADPVDPFRYTRRPITKAMLADGLQIGPMEPPRVFQPYPAPMAADDLAAWASDLANLQSGLRDARIEALVLHPGTCGLRPAALRSAIGTTVPWVIWDASDRQCDATGLHPLLASLPAGDGVLIRLRSADALAALCTSAAMSGLKLVLAVSPELLARLDAALLLATESVALITLDDTAERGSHAIGAYRQLAEVLAAINCRLPIWIRNTAAVSLASAHQGFGDRLLESSILSGSLLCDGIGDALSVETVESVRQSVTLSYNILQGARTRSVKTEFVACPSCGRTLFDLQSTTQRIRAATGHLKGVTIAVMGCIVNGPGEMADADFGYVGGAPGKINLYVGKQCVRYHVAAEDAVDALIELIREHGKWINP